MSNTQSAAPGVAAEETRHQFEQWAVENGMHDLTYMSSTPDRGYLRDPTDICWKAWQACAALQASAAAAKPVMWQYRMKRDQDDAWGLWTECAKSKYEQMTKDPVYLAWEPWRLEVRELYTASRTPAPGMAGGVVPASVMRILLSGDLEAALFKAEVMEDERLKLYAFRTYGVAAPHPAPAPQAVGAEPVSDEELAAATKAYNIYDDGEQPMAMHAALTTLLESRRRISAGAPAFLDQALNEGDGRPCRHGLTACLVCMNGPRAKPEAGITPSGTARDGGEAAE